MVSIDSARVLITSSIRTFSHSDSFAMANAAVFTRRLVRVGIGHFRAHSTSAPTEVARVPLRSVLYVPGQKADKARKPNCDGVILDLEDAVSPAGKTAARDAVVNEVAKGGFGPKLVAVRINGQNTEWHAEDVKAVVEASKTKHVSAVVVPKVESADDLREMQRSLASTGAQHVSVWAMIETPRGVLESNQIARAALANATNPIPLTCLVAGTSDLTKDLRALHTPSRTPMLTSLSTIVLAARAYGIRCLDGVHLALDDEEGLRNTCLQGRELGFDGKTLIHPSQIEEANVAFSPSPNDIKDAKEIVAAWDAARAASADGSGGAGAGSGVVVVNGRLIEMLHVHEAKALLALASAIEELNKAAAGAKT